MQYSCLGIFLLALLGLGASLEDGKQADTIGKQGRHCLSLASVGVGVEGFRHGRRGSFAFDHAFGMMPHQDVEDIVDGVCK